MSARTHYRVFDERTGDPVVDNRARQANKRLSDIRRRLTVKCQGRKRKKELSMETYRQLLELNLAVMRDLAQRAAT